MGPDQLVFFWLILSSLALIAMIFGIRYLNNKENMAMIEKGMDPKIKTGSPGAGPFPQPEMGFAAGRRRNGSVPGLSAG